MGVFYNNIFMGSSTEPLISSDNFVEAKTKRTIQFTFQGNIFIDNQFLVIRPHTVLSQGMILHSSNLYDIDCAIKLDRTCITNVHP